MKILLVNKFHFLKGGSETYYFKLGEMLKKFGHEVAYFSMDNPNNVVTGDKEYFVSEFNTNSKNIFKAFGAIYSIKNKKSMEFALDDFKPDIVHINLFQRHLTYSIIKPIKKRNIPVVFTSHDMQPICPASAMLCNGTICQKCLKASKFHCFFNKCIKNSYLKSLLMSIEAKIYKYKKVYNNFDLIITPSDFLHKKLEEELKRVRIVTLPNFVEVNEYKKVQKGDENYAFYFGRLSVEKGIINLLTAFSKQKEGKLYIAGDGPERSRIEEFIKNNNLGNRVKLLGFLNSKELKKYIAKSSFVVVPSICYENCPFSVLETLAIGKAIIGSRIGGIPELILNGENGLLYNYDSIDELKEKIEWMFKNKNSREKMGKNSLNLVEKKYDIKVYFQKLINYYEELLGDSNASKINE